MSVRTPIHDDLLVADADRRRIAGCRGRPVHVRKDLNAPPRSTDEFEQENPSVRFRVRNAAQITDHMWRGSGRDPQGRAANTARHG